MLVDVDSGIAGSVLAPSVTGLRLDYCGFGPFCSTGTKLLLSISVLWVRICIIYQ